MDKNGVFFFSALNYYLLIKYYLKYLHINQMINIFVVSIIALDMDNEKRKELLKNIQMEKIAVKIELNQISFLLKQNKIFQKRMDALLDRLKMLEELEEEISKQK
jgi:hypothetical protein